MLRYIFIPAVAVLLGHADKWSIQRNPFTVSDSYIQSTKKGYLEPKNNYIPFEIELLGVSHTAKGKEAILRIEFEGIETIGLHKSIVVNTPDIQSRLRVDEIFERYVVLSVNEGEGIRYEIK
jgi:hypothetical protein